LIDENTIRVGRSPSEIAMNRTIGSVLLLAAIVGLMATLGCQPAPEVPAAATLSTIPDETAPTVAVPAEDLKALVEANNQFAFDLYKEIAKTEKGNIFFSPYSIHAALSMTYAGARGETAAEMAKVLHIDNLGDRVHPAHAELARKLKSDGKDGKPEFHVANALWGQKGFGFRPEFLSLTKQSYVGGFKELDFVGDTEGSRKSINKWVSDQTREKIPELLRKENVTIYTRLAVTNAVYFKGVWTEPFPKGATENDRFHISATEKLPVRMMNRMNKAKYFQGDGIKLAVVPYRGRDCSMIVIVPDEIDGLKKSQFSIIPRQISGWVKASQPGVVTLQMPKLQVDQRVELSSNLEALGMQRCFRTPDFSGISTEKIRLTDVIHEAIVEIDEDGTVAAAATAIVSEIPVSIPEVLVSIAIRADRPYLVMIIDERTNLVLFLGHINNPAVP